MTQPGFQLLLYKVPACAPASCSLVWVGRARTEKDREGCVESKGWGFAVCGVTWSWGAAVKAMVLAVGVGEWKGLT